VRAEALQALLIAAVAYHNEEKMGRAITSAVHHLADARPRRQLHGVAALGASGVHQCRLIRAILIGHMLSRVRQCRMRASLLERAAPAHFTGGQDGELQLTLTAQRAHDSAHADPLDHHRNRRFLAAARWRHQ
jgi:hypothetical protein